jgi:hypothetical protein
MNIKHGALALVVSAFSISATAQVGVRPGVPIPDPRSPGIPNPFPGPLPIPLKPDLVVSRLTLVEPSSITPSGSARATVDVVVLNRGNVSAGAFKTAVQYTEADGREYVVAFTVDGQSSPWYPFTSTLAARAQVTLRGWLTFHPALHGVPVTVRAIADSCSGDEFMPEHCRVRESSELDNASAPLSLTLP